jgi:hypothetical protein
MYQHTMPKTLRRIEGAFRPGAGSGPAFKYRLMRTPSEPCPDVGCQIGQADRQQKTTFLKESRGAG